MCGKTLKYYNFWGRPPLSSRPRGRVPRSPAFATHNPQAAFVAYIIVYILPQTDPI